MRPEIIIGLVILILIGVIYYGSVVEGVCTTPTIGNSDIILNYLPSSGTDVTVRMRNYRNKCTSGSNEAYAYHLCRKGGGGFWNTVLQHGLSGNISTDNYIVDISGYPNVAAGEYRLTSKCKKNNGNWTDWRQSSRITIPDSAFGTANLPDCNCDKYTWPSNCTNGNYCRKGKCNPVGTKFGRCRPICFPEMAIVNNRPISELKIGDIVDTPSGQSKVTTFLHREPKTKAIMIRFILSNNTKTTVSDTHLIYSNGEYKTADKVRIGDYVEYNGNPVGIVGKFKIMTEGLYAPLTENGTITVDNINYSCYVQPDKIKNIRDFHNKANTAMYPLRITETDPKTPIHWYCKPLMSLVGGAS